MSRLPSAREWAAALTLLSLSCSPGPPRHLLLITIDTLRPDHLGSYGYTRPTSPALDRLAAEGIVFERAYGTASWTLPSLASVMTAHYPSTHGCRHNSSRLPPGMKTLAGHLDGAGFRTGAVVSHVFLDPRYGLDRGFADYDDELVLATPADSHRVVSSPEITEKALAWLEERRRQGTQRWFLWLHYFDPHQDYLRHPGTTEVFGSEPMDRYDGEIAFTDAHIGRVLDALETLDFANRTLVFVVSDHGEAFGEHGQTGHRLTLYDEELRVAMLVRSPGIAPGRATQPVSLVDVAPTALELLGLPPAEQAPGSSLVPALRGEAQERGPLLAEMRSFLSRDRVQALVSGEWKLVLWAGREPRLYHLAGDPGERHEVAAQHPDVVRELDLERAELVARAAELAPEDESMPPLRLPAEIQRRLRALGYAEEEPAPAR